jgi:hypothetical protein
MKAALEPKQLDLFVDGHDAFVVHEVLTRLLSRDDEGALAWLVRLREEHPAHPDLGVLTILVDGLDARLSMPVTHGNLGSRIEAIERALVPAARRFFGTDAPVFLRPLWHALATAAASLPFDAVHPRVHAGWLHQQCEDWPAVRAAVESEPGWAATPLLRYWLGLARHHLGEREAAIQVWVPLCWMDPALFTRHAPMLPNTTLREGWEAFERTVGFDEFLADTAEPAAWFPAWLLARHRGLAQLFAADDIPETGPPTRAFRALLALAPLETRGLSDELVARRRALREASPEFFRHYMGIVGRRR